MDKQPWLDAPHLWKDEKAFLQWLRSVTRRIWSKHPIKIEYKNSRRYKAPVGKKTKRNPEGMVWVSDCEMCGCQSRSCQVDHIEPGGSFTDWETYTKWAKRILVVGFDDVRELCKECHDVVTLSQKLGISVESASTEKQVISWTKDTPIHKQKEFLASRSLPCNNAQTRRNSYREYLEGMK